MAQIVNGTYNNYCCSNNLCTLFEWCLNTKEDVTFEIKTSKNLYKVTVIFQNYPSEGTYLSDNYNLELLVDILLEDNHGGKHWYTSLLTNSEYTIDDMIQEFTIEILENNQIDKYFGYENN